MPLSTREQLIGAAIAVAVSAGVLALFFWMGAGAADTDPGIWANCWKEPGAKYLTCGERDGK